MPAYQWSRCNHANAAAAYISYTATLHTRGESLALQNNMYSLPDIALVVLQLPSFTPTLD